MSYILELRWVPLIVFPQQSSSGVNMLLSYTVSFRKCIFPFLSFVFISFFLNLCPHLHFPVLWHWRWWIHGAEKSEASFVSRASKLNNEVNLDSQNLTSLWISNFLKKSMCFPSGAGRCFLCEGADLPGSPLDYPMLKFTALTWLKKVCKDQWICAVNFFFEDE